MSLDCSWIAVTTPHVSPSMPNFASVYPMPLIVRRTTLGMSTYVSVLISPATRTRPVVTSVSHATRPSGSSDRIESRTASEIWSASLSGWPSVTDSEVNRYRLATIRGGLYLPVRTSSPNARASAAGLVGLGDVRNGCAAAESRDRAASRAPTATGKDLAHDLARALEAGVFVAECVPYVCEKLRHHTRNAHLRLHCRRPDDVVPDRG